MTRVQEWDKLAAGFATLGRFHRAPPHAAELAAVHELLPEWPLAETLHAQEGMERLQASFLNGESPERIARDHDRLYGVSATAAVPPYESVHRGIDRLVFDAQTLEVRRAYQELGLQAPNLNREPDDHVGLEFDFVAQALISAIDAVADGRNPDEVVDVARTFLGDHLLVWAPVMLEKVATNADTDFMAGVALLSMGALESARALLGASVPPQPVNISR